MEFACEFVYVPPQSQRDGKRPNVPKRSALLPPVNRVRPRTPPPPPPTHAASAKSPKSLVKPPQHYENVGFHVKLETACSNNATSSQSATPRKTAPALPPRPSFMTSMPDYLVVLPASPPTSSSLKSPSNPSLSQPSATKASTDKEPLPGNPNVVLVSLGKLLSEEKVQSIHSEPTFCPQCCAVLDSCYYNLDHVCRFCQLSDLTSLPHTPPSATLVFSLEPDEKPTCAADALLFFCIDISGSMSMTSQVALGEDFIHRTRLEFVQEAVTHCVHSLGEEQPGIRVGLITFNHQVTIHGYESVTSHTLSGADLLDVDYMKEAAASFPTPPPLSHTKDFLTRQVLGLSESGTTALGPAALLAIAMASRQPGSKVIICTDGKANTGLGNLEEEDMDACTLLSSTIFYQDLGDYAANQGVTVSVLSIEGTDCRLDELGRLADRTRGKVVIADPNMLHQEFEDIIMDRTIATHCTVTVQLPKSLQMRGEREAGHKGTREVGNVAPDTEITFQFGASEQDTDVAPPASGSRVSIQLQIRYRQSNGQAMLRVITSDRDVTDDSAAALSSLSLAIIQLNSSQASAALAVRGRFVDARREGELQRKLIERAIEHNHSVQDEKTYQNWVKTMEPIYNNIHNFTRRQSVISDSQSLTDAGAALLYTMKQSNRKSISLKNKHQH